jgi:hypothetical protein
VGKYANRNKKRLTKRSALGMNQVSFEKESKKLGENLDQVFYGKREKGASRSC